ncbi:hypothetical protein [Dorea sp. D27]|uniref:hypothetical protein n=1 Tax=Dorea sp. D27 TaxID=658665 RepID=UPI003FA46F2D
MASLRSASLRSARLRSALSRYSTALSLPLLSASRNLEDSKGSACPTFSKYSGLTQCVPCPPRWCCNTFTWMFSRGSISTTIPFVIAEFVIAYCPSDSFVPLIISPISNIYFSSYFPCLILFLLFLPPAKMKAFMFPGLNPPDIFCLPPLWLCLFSSYICPPIPPDYAQGSPCRSCALKSC